jgi:divalent metal cation (Fe/Co/Zn/Cd) transporter
MNPKAPDPLLVEEIRSIATTVPGVFGTYKCPVRKLGFDHYVDLGVLCDPEASIRYGHQVAHDVGTTIHERLSRITKILVHVEPVDDYGRR